eukprot:207732-Amphidinium_carterae.1
MGKKRTYDNRGQTTFSGAMRLLPPADHAAQVSEISILSGCGAFIMQKFLRRKKKASDAPLLDEHGRRIVALAVALEKVRNIL